MQFSTTTDEVRHASQPAMDGRPGQPFPIRFPKDDYGDAQNEEWCEVYIRGDWLPIRLHDYGQIYNIPGLYEHLFHNLLRCNSPQRVVGLLAEVMNEHALPPTTLGVLDLGAGSGLVGRQLRALGVRDLIGIDLLPEAEAAARRDRPGLYDDYLVSDLCKNDLRDRKDDFDRLNCLVCVAALGFGDIPVRAFSNALNAISTPGWLAFNIKEQFLTGDDSSGFCRFIRELCDEGIIRIEAYRRYSHRLSIAGKRLYYVAIAARKLREVPEELIQASE